IIQSKLLSKKIFIIADKIEGSALNFLVQNKMRNVIDVCAINAPGFGDRKTPVLEDIAALTGATLIDIGKGMHIKDATLSYVGTASFITCDEHTTIISAT